MRPPCLSFFSFIFFLLFSCLVFSFPVFQASGRRMTISGTTSSTVGLGTTAAVPGCCNRRCTRLLLLLLSPHTRTHTHVHTHTHRQTHTQHTRNTHAPTNSRAGGAALRSCTMTDPAQNSSAQKSPTCGTKTSMFLSQARAASPKCPSSTWPTTPAKLRLRSGS